MHCDIAFNVLRVAKQPFADVRNTAYKKELNVSDF